MGRPVDVAEDDLYAPYDYVEPLFVTGRYFRRRMAVTETLYHYTTAAGLVGILSGACLRATNFSFLNDSSEFRYGINIVAQLLRDEETRMTDDTDRACLTRTVALFENASSSSEIYVACFSDKRDKLSQWRAYGNAGPAAAFCIGFDGARLSHIAAKTALRLDRVIYARDEQTERALYLIGSALSKFDRIVSPTEVQVEDVAAALAQRLLESAAFLKDAHYVEENEYRVVCDAPALDRLEFEASADRIRPYVPLIRGNDFEERQLPVVEITFAAVARPEQVRKSIKLLLLRYGYSDVQVTQTTIPF